MEPSLKDNPRLLNVVRNRFACFSLSLFQLSDGTLIAQELPGIMKSGSYLTSSMNSRIRCLMAEIIGSEWCIAMGDDSVEAFVEDAPAKYLALGHTCKEYELCPTDFEGILESVEFCSHKIEAEGSFLVPWAKTLYRYLSSKTPQFHDTIRAGNQPPLAIYPSISRVGAIGSIDKTVLERWRPTNAAMPRRRDPIPDELQERARQFTMPP